MNFIKKKENNKKIKESINSDIKSNNEIKKSQIEKETQIKKSNEIQSEAENQKLKFTENEIISLKNKIHNLENENNLLNNETKKQEDFNLLKQKLIKSGNENIELKNNY